MGNKNATYQGVNTNINNNSQTGSNQIPETDSIRLEEEKKKKELSSPGFKCYKKHQLLFRNPQYPNNLWYCDRCSKEFSKDVCGWHCIECQFDLCENCAPIGPLYCRPGKHVNLVDDGQGLGLCFHCQQFVRMG